MKFHSHCNRNHVIEIISNEVYSLLDLKALPETWRSNSLKPFSDLLIHRICWKGHWGLEEDSRTGMGLDSLLSRAQTMVSRNNAADEMLSKENMGLTSWVLKSHSWANTLLPQSALSEFPLLRGKRDWKRGMGCEYYLRTYANIWSCDEKRLQDLISGYNIYIIESDSGPEMTFMNVSLVTRTIHRIALVPVKLYICSLAFISNENITLLV